VARIRAVLLDVDGTLLDTRDAWVRAFDAGLAAVRRTSIPGSVAAQWIGTPIETIYVERCGLSGDDLAKAVRVFQQVEAESVREGMRAYPGIREALAALRAWKLAAVTNKRHDTTVEALRVTELLPFFVLVLGGDSVPRKKPFPDPILQAAKALDVTPSECVVVGDTENDVRAIKPVRYSRKFSDGRGLYLLVTPTGGRYWRLDYRFARKGKTLALGIYPEVPLERARSRREFVRNLLAHELDPSVLKTALGTHVFVVTMREWAMSQARRLNDLNEHCAADLDE